jgi:hypothetical protein
MLDWFVVGMLCTVGRLRNRRLLHDLTWVSVQIFKLDEGLLSRARV